MKIKKITFFIVAFLMCLSQQSFSQGLGFVEDFSDPAFPGWTFSANNTSLSQVNANEMTITLLKETANGTEWGHVTRSFSALDLTDAPYLSFEISTTADVAFYAQISDGSVPVDGSQTQGSVTAAEGFKTIYMKVTTWEGQDWNNGGELTAVDPTNVSAIVFKFAHGQDYSGDVVLRNLRIGSQAQLESGDSYADDFEDATLPGWAGDAGYTVSQENPFELKVNLVKETGNNEWGNLVKTFDAIDLTANPYVRVKIKADAELYLKVQPGNTGTDIWAEDGSSDVTIPVGTEFVEYTFKTTAWIGYTWPGPEEVDADPTQVNGVRFRMAHGQDYNGNIYLKEFRVGAIAAPTELDFTNLESLIAVAEGLIEGAVEGTEPGEYEVGSIALLQAVVDDAKGLLGDQYTTQQVIDETAADLQTAISIFSTSKIQDPNAGKAVVKKITTSIIIDGDASDADWALANQFPIDLPYALVQSNPIENATDLSGFWSAAWDEEYFYLLVDIQDENVDEWTSVGNPWERDLVEVYFNMDGVDGAIGTDNAFQYPFGYVTGTEQPNPGSGNTDWTDLSWSTVLIDGGWRLEAAFPMASIGRELSTYEDSLLFEISILDQDDGDGTKTARLVWAVDINELGASNAGMWGKEEHMGTIIFDEGTTGVNNPTSVSFDIFPNPVNNLLYINSQDNIDKVDIIDMTGKIIKSVDLNSNSGFINTTDLIKGAYIISVSNEKGVFNHKVIKN